MTFFFLFRLGAFAHHSISQKEAAAAAAAKKKKLERCRRKRPAITGNRREKKERKRFQKLLESSNKNGTPNLIFNGLLVPPLPTSTLYISPLAPTKGTFFAVKGENYREMPLVFFLISLRLYHLSNRNPLVLHPPTTPLEQKKIYKSSTPFKTIFVPVQKLSKLQGSPSFLSTLRVEIILYFYFSR